MQYGSTFETGFINVLKPRKVFDTVIFIFKNDLLT